MRLSCAEALQLGHVLEGQLLTDATVVPLVLDGVLLRKGAFLVVLAVAIHIGVGKLEPLWASASFLLFRPHFEILLPGFLGMKPPFDVVARLLLLKPQQHLLVLSLQLLSIQLPPHFLHLGMSAFEILSLLIPKEEHRRIRLVPVSARIEIGLGSGVVVDLVQFAHHIVLVRATQKAHARCPRSASREVHHIPDYNYKFKC